MKSLTASIPARLRGLFERADPEAFSLVLSTARRAKFHVHMLPGPEYFATRTANELTWVPNSTAQHVNATQGFMHPLSVTHAVMHYLCFAHSGFSTRRKPGSMLYFENIACNIDAYFGARITQQVGVSAVEKRLLGVYPFAVFEKTRQRLGRSRRDYLRHLAKEEPFALFKRVVAEVDEVQRLVHQISLHFEPGEGPRVPLEELGRAVAKMPYLTFSSYFNHNLHRMFARFHEGTRSSKADQRTKRECQSVLASSRSFSGFMSALGAV